MSPVDWVRKQDLWLIRTIFEPIAWHIEIRFNKNNFWISRMVLILFVVGITLFLISRGGIYVLFLVPIYIGITGVYFSSLRVERVQRSRPNHPNWAKIMGLPLRIYALVSALVILPLGIDTGWFVAATGFLLHVYFSACDPMPPKWKEEREKKQQEKLVPQVSRF
jgi:hypothetical protein